METKDKKNKLEDAIRNGGFYGKNGVWNSLITFYGDPKIYRKRVETLIVKDRKFVFVKKRLDGTYFLPGGSTEKDIPDIIQAENECREEAHINIKNIMSTGIAYKKNTINIDYLDLKDYELKWNAMYTEIYAAEYDSMFNGHIDRVDEDPFIRSGKFYSTKECFKFFNKEHKEALLWYLKSLNQDDNKNVVTESYLINYFKNKKLLKKISNNPEISRSSVDEALFKLKKEYNRLMATSKIKREQRKADVALYFHPVLNFDFSDGASIAICLNFNENNFSAGGAIHSNEFGDIVIIYPIFFKYDRETQTFILLHEIGHIRLQHTKLNNYKTNIFGTQDKSDNYYRLTAMKNGKVVYPELNADLYAVLNGAAMYSILGNYVQKDVDNDFDYRFTNDEIANRYDYVFKQYGKLRGYTESNFTKYDTACIALYEMVYDNDNLISMNITDKNNLYSILFEYCINKKIHNSSITNKENKLNDALLNFNDKCESLKYIIEGTDDDANDGTTMMKEKYELSKLKNEVNNAYYDLYFERAKEYESLSQNDYNNFHNYGKNLIAAKICNDKSIIVTEMYNTMCEIEDKLKNKNIDLSITENSKSKVQYYLYLVESLTKAERDAIPDDKFGIPELHSYPLDTKKHVHSAIVLFGKSDPKYRDELSKNIFEAMKQFNLSYDIIGENSKLYKYLQSYLQNNK